jgi:hypothetical protein
MARIIFEINGSDRLVLPLDTERTEAELIRLAQQEADRHQVSLAAVNIRFALDEARTPAKDPQKS